MQSLLRAAISTDTPFIDLLVETSVIIMSVCGLATLVFPQIDKKEPHRGDLEDLLLSVELQGAF